MHDAFLFAYGMIAGGLLATFPVFFVARLTISSNDVLKPIRDKMNRRRKRHLEREYAEQENGHPREKCPLADES